MSLHQLFASIKVHLRASMRPQAEQEGVMILRRLRELGDAATPKPVDTSTQDRIETPVDIAG